MLTGFFCFFLKRFSGFQVCFVRVFVSTTFLLDFRTFSLGFRFQLGLGQSVFFGFSGPGMARANVFFEFFSKHTCLATYRQDELGGFFYVFGPWALRRPSPGPSEATQNVTSALSRKVFLTFLGNVFLSFHCLEGSKKKHKKNSLSVCFLH